MGIAITPVEPRRVDRLAVKLTVTNRGETPIVWDRDFCFFLKWHVRCDNSSDLERSHLSSAPAPTPERSRERFIVLAPGESLTSKEIVMNKSLKFFQTARGTLAGGAHVSLGTEEQVRFVVPASSRSVSVQVEYSVDNDEEGGFYSLMGRTIDDVKLPRGHYISNVCLFELPR